MQNNSAALAVNPQHWLKNAPFDLTLILAVTVFALGSGAVVVFFPKIFLAVLMIDIWFLSSPHVIATFSRLSFDAESYKQYQFLVIWLPLIVVFCTVTAGFAFGPWIIATTNFYWQWFHYTRQSYGIARIYQLKADPKSKEVDKGIIYGLPLLGILYRSYQNPGTFLGSDLRVLPVPFEVVALLTVLVATWMSVWAVRQYRSIREGTFSAPFFMFMCSHIAIFLTGYIVINDVSCGWLVINVWHNVQYILFVWLYHNRKFKNTYDPARRFLSLLSLNTNHWLFYGVCLALSFAFYGGVSKLLGIITLASLPAVSLAIIQTANFHHYIVDGIIWRVRQKTVSNNLGLKTAG